jgi:hypothetical protein
LCRSNQERAANNQKKCNAMGASWQEVEHLSKKDERQSKRVDVTVTRMGTFEKTRAIA